MTDETKALQFSVSKRLYESTTRYVNEKNESFLVRVSSEDLEVLKEYTNSLTAELEPISREDDIDLSPTNMTELGEQKRFSLAQLDETLVSVVGTQLDRVEEAFSVPVEISIENVEVPGLQNGSLHLILKSRDDILVYSYQNHFTHHVVAQEAVYLEIAVDDGMVSAQLQKLGNPLKSWDCNRKKIVVSHEGGGSYQLKITNCDSTKSSYKIVNTQNALKIYSQSLPVQSNNRPLA